MSYPNVNNGDSGLVARGKINAGLTAQRTVLTADTIFYVTTTGDDTTGDGSVGNPWLTLQHAINWLAANIDGGGFSILIQFADGTYVGASMFDIPPNVANYAISGNQSDSTAVTLTDVGLSTSAVFDFEVSNGSVNLFSFTVEVTIPGNSGITNGLNTQTISGDINYANINFTTAVGGGDCLGNFSTFGFVGGGMNNNLISGGAWNPGAFSVTGDWVSCNHLNGSGAQGFSDNSGGGLDTRMNGASFSQGFFYNTNDPVTFYTASDWKGSVTGDFVSMGASSTFIDFNNSYGDGNAAWVSIGGTSYGAIVPGGRYNDFVASNQYTVSTLPPAATFGAGARLFVTDSDLGTTAGIGTVVVHTVGANKVPVYSDGTNWIIG